MLVQVFTRDVLKSALERAVTRAQLVILDTKQIDYEECKAINDKIQQQIMDLVDRIGCEELFRKA